MMPVQRSEMVCAHCQRPLGLFDRFVILPMPDSFAPAFTHSGPCPPHDDIPSEHV